MSVGGAHSKLVLDPNIDVDETPMYLIEKGPSYCRYFSSTSTSYSDSSINFSITPPNRIIGVDKRIFIDMSATFTFAGDAGAGNLLMPTQTYNGVQYLVGETDALRWFPLQSCTNSLSITFNQSTVSQILADYIEAISRVGFTQNYEDHELSVAPSMHDQFQEFGDWTYWGSARNPLAPFGDVSSQQSRGAFRLEVSTNTQFEAIVHAVWSEPLLISPLALGKMQQKAFLGLQNIDFNFNLDNLSRMWCHDAVNAHPGEPGLSGPPTVNIDAPVLRLRFLTIPLIEQIPRTNLYPYCDVQRFVTNVGSSLNPGVATSVTGNTVQLSSIPRRVILFCRERNLDRSFLKPDCYARIDSVQVNWDNKNDLLTSCTSRDLYRMSVESGLQMSWEQWNSYSGSVLVIDFASQIGLDDLQAPGMHGCYQLQITCKFTNIGSRAINYAFYMVVCSEGIFRLDETLSSVTVGDVVPRDVLEGVQMSQIEKMPFHDAYDFTGGSFWSSLKRVASKAANFAAEHGPELIAKYGPQALRVASMLGLGNDQLSLTDRAMLRASNGSGLSGSGLTGGRRIPRETLRKKMF